MRLTWLPQKKTLQLPELSIATVRALLTDHCFKVFNGDQLCHVGMLIETQPQFRRAQQYDDLKSLFDAMSYTGNEPSLEDTNYRVSETESGELLLDGALCESEEATNAQPEGAASEISYFRLFSASYQYAARLHAIENIRALEHWVFSRPGCLEELVGKTTQRIAQDGSSVFSWFLAQEVIFVNLAYAAEFSALVPETAYLLTLASPISNKMNLAEYCRGQADALARLEDFVEGLRARYPLVRLSINEDADNSYFYLCASVDLPLLVKHGQLEMLSLHEVEMAFYDLKHFADDLETALYGASQDLSRHDLQSECQANVGARLFSAAGRQVSDELIWRDAGGVHGGVASLSQLLPASAPEKAARSTELELTATSQFFRLLQLNHHFPFATFLKEGDAYRLVLNYPKDDLQPEERQLLERWFRYLLAVCR